MSLIWGEVAGTAAAATPGVDVGAALALAGYIIVTGIGYWLTSDQPASPDGVSVCWYDPGTGKGTVGQ